MLTEIDDDLFVRIRLEINSKLYFCETLLTYTAFDFLSFHSLAGC